MTRDEQLLETVKRLATETARKEALLAKRKLAKMEQSRNDWREAARRYQKQLIERNQCVNPK